MLFAAFILGNSLVGVCSAGYLQPVAIAKGSLASGGAQEALERAFVDDGLVQVTEIPGFASLREQVLQHAHACIAASPQADSYIFADGTVRRTLATAWGPTLGKRLIEHGSADSACGRLEAASQSFRSIVRGVADTMVGQMSAMLHKEGYMLRRRSGDVYSTLQEAVEFGDRLEHFHTYAVPGATPTADDNTLDFHVDQGIFIAFVPAMMVDTAAQPQGVAAGKFIVKTDAGEELEVHLQPDALVFLLGDGANQYLNKMRDGRPFVAPRHAFRMPVGSQDLHRVWYGMMQLPPADALDESTEMTFGEIRAQLVQFSETSEVPADSALTLGCSRRLHPRELSGSCASDQIYCWHRCFNHTDDASPAACAEQNLSYNCVNQFDQLYVGGHGDFWPTCTNSTEEYAPRPPVEQPTGACPGFDDLVNDGDYEHRVKLANDTYLLWNVQSNMFHAKMIHNGLVGWMSLGLENPGGYHNGMNGGEVVMGRRMEDGAMTVAEYRIHDSSSAFRFWKDPFDPPMLQEASMTTTDCFSTLEFKTQSIYGKALNISEGTNRLMWALTHLDYCTDDSGGYSGYHRNTDRDPRENFRGLVELDFTSDGLPEQENENSGASPRSPCFLTFVGAVFLACRRA